MHIFVSLVAGIIQCRLCPLATALATGRASAVTVVDDEEGISQRPCSTT